MRPGGDTPDDAVPPAADLRSPRPGVETITWKGRLGPMGLGVSSRTFRPTTITHVLAQAMEVRRGDVVIDVGCGSGILGIIAAKLGASRVYGTDVSPDVVDVASGNAARHGVAHCTTFFQGDLFSALPSDVRADLIVGDVSGVPDELAADSGWFPSRTGGGRRGCELPIRMIREAGRRLAPAGRMLLPTATLQDEPPILDAARAAFASDVKVAQRAIPLPSAIAEADSLKRLAQEGVIHLGTRGSRLIWDARVWRCDAAPGSGTA